MLDLDQQHDATKILATPNTILAKTISDLLEQPDEIGASDCICRSAEGIDFIGSSNRLTNTEMRLSGEVYRETILKRALEDVKNSYDYIILDCPPSMGLLTLNVLAAADFGYHTSQGK